MLMSHKLHGRSIVRTQYCMIDGLSCVGCAHKRTMYRATHVHDCAEARDATQPFRAPTTMARSTKRQTHVVRSEASAFPVPTEARKTA